MDYNEMAAKKRKKLKKSEMKAFFVSQRDQWEVELAAEAKRRQQPGGKGAPGSG